MTSAIAWFAILTATAVAIVSCHDAVLRLGASHVRLKGVPLLWCAAVVSLSLTAVLCVLLRIHAYASLDAKIVDSLARERSDALTTIFKLVTTLGDLVPSLLLAFLVGMGLWLTQRVSRRIVVAIPTVVLIEIALQFLLIRLFRDPTIGQLEPHLSLGAAGAAPSGATARLLILSLFASRIVGASGHIRRGPAVLAPSMVLIEVTSRLYLGRHFVTDIAAGLSTGVLVFLVAYPIIFRSDFSGNQLQAQTQSASTR